MGFIQDHDELVVSIKELVVRMNIKRSKRSRSGRLRDPPSLHDTRLWEFIVVQAEQLTKDEQIRLLSRTSVRTKLYLRGISSGNELNL